MARKTTHLLLKDVLGQYRSEKTCRALDWGIAVVSFRWLYDSLQAGALLLQLGDYITDRPGEAHRALAVASAAAGPRQPLALIHVNCAPPSLQADTKASAGSKKRHCTTNAAPEHALPAPQDAFSFASGDDPDEGAASPRLLLPALSAVGEDVNCLGGADPHGDEAPERPAPASQAAPVGARALPTSQRSPSFMLVMSELSEEATLSVAARALPAGAAPVSLVAAADAHAAQPPTPTSGVSSLDAFVTQRPDPSMPAPQQATPQQPMAGRAEGRPSDGRGVGPHGSDADSGAAPPQEGSASTPSSTARQHTAAAPSYTAEAQPGAGCEGSCGAATPAESRAPAHPTGAAAQSAGEPSREPCAAPGAVLYSGFQPPLASIATVGRGRARRLVRADRLAARDEAGEGGLEGLEDDLGPPAPAHPPPPRPAPAAGPLRAAPAGEAPPGAPSHEPAGPAPAASAGSRLRPSLAASGVSVGSLRSLWQQRQQHAAAAPPPGAPPPGPPPPPPLVRATQAAARGGPVAVAASAAGAGPARAAAGVVPSCAPTACASQPVPVKPDSGGPGPQVRDPPLREAAAASRGQPSARRRDAALATASLVAEPARRVVGPPVPAAPGGGHSAGATSDWGSDSGASPPPASTPDSGATRGGPLGPQAGPATIRRALAARAALPPSPMAPLPAWLNADSGASPAASGGTSSAAPGRQGDGDGEGSASDSARPAAPPPRQLLARAARLRRLVAGLPLPIRAAARAARQPGSPPASRRGAGAGAAGGRAGRRGGRGRRARPAGRRRARGQAHGAAAAQPRRARAPPGRAAQGGAVGRARGGVRGGRAGAPGAQGPQPGAGPRRSHTRCVCGPMALPHRPALASPAQVEPLQLLLNCRDRSRRARCPILALQREDGSPDVFLAEP